MSLTTALNIAQAALLNTARQTGVVSRNVTEANNPDYSRRSAPLVSTAPGARTVQVQRAANDLLFKQNLSALASWAGQDAVTTGMETLGVSLNGVDDASSVASAISALQQALQTYSATPSSRPLAETAIDAARQVVRALNDGSSAIQAFRARTDADIAAAVDDLNGLLAQFGENNKAVIQANQSGRDASDLLDQRDALLKQISQYVPISTLERGSGDMMLMTGDGTVLFETIPRAVSFTPSPGYGPTTAGSPVYIDGVPLSAGSTGNTDASGRIAGLLQLRDGVSVTAQNQLDEIARGLISTFAEEDPAGVLSDVPGLFSWSGAPAMPGGGLVPGLAGMIEINAAMDTAQGGNPEYLRDGSAYAYNPSGGPGYADRLIAYGDRLDEPMAFDALGGISTTSSVSDYATASVGWFEGLRQQASSAAEAKQALAQRTGDALSNDTGVNIDTELSLLLQLEHSYQASARLIATVDNMFNTLLQAV